MNSLHIRDARDSDRDVIRDVTLSAYEEYAALMPQHWEDYRRDVLATLTDVRPAEQIVAEQDGAIVGTVLLYPAGAVLDRPDGTLVSTDWPEVRLLAVAPAARGQGVATALMQECVRRARRSRAAALTLHTTDMMQVAMRMYEHMGFVRAPELDFRPAEDVIVKGYRLNLNGTTA
jgi:GNAT superfamily N-acetyltransferase